MEDFLEELFLNQNKLKPEFSIQFNEKLIPLFDCKIVRSSHSNGPSVLRGGVYYSGSSSFNLIGFSKDMSLSNFTSKLMLGPNKDFEEIKILVTLSDEQQNVKIMKGFLLNLFELSSKIQLNLMIIN